MTIMSNQIYNVPGIPPDLRREETILQIADSLDYLDKVANDIFNRISSKVSNNTNRLQKVNERVALAQARVKKLTGSNKATKVHAGAKYPIGEKFDEYSSIFGKGANLKEPKRPHYRLQTKHENVDDRVFRDKLQYYNVHLNVKKRARDGNNQAEGLGGLPKALPSISSLLLFNTSENPYKKYVMLDPLGVVTKTRSTLENEEACLADAPATIVQSEDMLQQNRESYSYMPDIGQVPEIAVPDFLPNLLGVADDLSFTGDMLSSIAPSVRGSSNIPDLPSVLPEPDIPKGPALGGTMDAVPGAPPTGPPPPPTGPPPPPTGPPPPPPTGPPPPPAGPPPPVDAPPPPPGPAPAIKVDNAPAEVETPSDGRSSLLDSIRKAGGLKKLKSGKDRKIASKKKKVKEKESGGKSGGGGGGDLMGDLFAKLSMRRKGISGSSKPEKSDTSIRGGDSAMDKISSMIPSPPKPTNETPADNNDDWE